MATQDPSRAKRVTISAPFLSLRSVSSISVIRSPDLKHFKISSSYEFVPDIEGEWSDQYQHYRIYANVASQNYAKTRAGYAICRIRSAISAALLATFVHFLFTHRAKKEVAN